MSFSREQYLRLIQKKQRTREEEDEMQYLERYLIAETHAKVERLLRLQLEKSEKSIFEQVFGR